MTCKRSFSCCVIQILRCRFSLSTTVSYCHATIIDKTSPPAYHNKGDFEKLPTRRLFFWTGEAGSVAGAATTKIGLISLGCPKNLVDSEEMLGSLVDTGCAEMVGDTSAADVLVVNT